MKVDRGSGAPRALASAVPPASTGILREGPAAPRTHASSRPRSAGDADAARFHRTARRRGVRPGTVAVWGLAATALAVGVLLCALALVALAGVTSLAAGPWRPVGDQMSGALERTGQAVAASGQAVRDIFDPTHPPRDAL